MTICRGTILIDPINRAESFPPGLHCSTLTISITFTIPLIVSIVISITLLMMIVIGGLGSIHGAFFGAVVVAFLPQFLSMTKDLIGGSSVAIPGLETGVFGMILILFILFEPMGIYGRWMKIRIWFELFPFARKDMFKRQKSYLKTERLR